MEADDLVKQRKDNKPRPSKLQVVCDTVWLAVTTAVLLVVYITSALSTSSGGRFGFKNSTGDVSDIFFTQVTPPGFTFSIWGVIYTWQALWVLYAWTFVCRPKMPRTIFTGVYIGYALVNATNITWIYVWGNLELNAACVILFLFNVFFYPTLGMLVGYFYKVRSEPHKADTVLTWILPVNGLFLYATWTTIASLINLAAALQYSSSVNVSATDSATVSLSLLLVALVVYFILENTVLYRFLRYVFSVYPVVIWALIGVVSEHWGVQGEERNSRFALGLLIISIIALIVRIVLVVIFSVRSISKYRTVVKV